MSAPSQYRYEREWRPAGETTWEAALALFAAPPVRVVLAYARDSAAWAKTSCRQPVNGWMSGTIVSPNTAVVEQGRGLAGAEFEVDGDGVSLGCPDPVAVGFEPANS